MDNQNQNPENPQSDRATQEQPNQTVQTPAADTQPVLNTNPSEIIGLTGSQVQQVPKKLPVGIYVIVGFLFLGFILGFFNDNTTIIYTLLLFVNVGLGLGLLLKREGVRKTLVIVSSITIVLTAITISRLYLVQNRANQRANDAQTALDKIENNSSASQQQVSLANGYKAQISDQQKLLHKTYALAYIENSIVILANICQVIYLKRPKVKEVFTN